VKDIQRARQLPLPVYHCVNRAVYSEFAIFQRTVLCSQTEQQRTVRAQTEQLASRISQYPIAWTA